MEMTLCVNTTDQRPADPTGYPPSHAAFFAPKPFDFPNRFPTVYLSRISVPTPLRQKITAPLRPTGEGPLGRLPADGDGGQGLPWVQPQPPDSYHPAWLEGTQLPAPDPSHPTPHWVDGRKKRESTGWLSSAHLPPSNQTKPPEHPLCGRLRRKESFRKEKKKRKEPFRKSLGWGRRLGGWQTLPHPPNWVTGWIPIFASPRHPPSPGG